MSTTLSPYDHDIRIPIKIWSAVDPARDKGWDIAFKQLRNLANHPLAYKYICAMPDLHLGYGMPIGGVLATQGGVIPTAVGVDIGCGMIAVRTSIIASTISRTTLEGIREEIHKRVPVGKDHHPDPLPVKLMPLDLDMHEGAIVTQQFDRACSQLGTLGGGNHFIELQKDENDYLWIMIHSGSRNIGWRVCDHYHKIAKKYMTEFHSDIPNLDLSFLPQSVPEYEYYMEEMNWCMAFAEKSRALMLEQVELAFLAKGITFKKDFEIDTHHNFAAMENHFGKNLLIHRKGAVKAKGYVTIPGSMGTASYIGLGLEPEESFNTCSHGAGRRMGRLEANRTANHENSVAAMEHVVYGVRQGDYDEMPRCYKDIDAVMEAQKDLVKPVYRLVPLAVVKG